MRMYTIEQLTEADTEGLRTYLDDMDLRSSIEDVYWLPVPESLLTPIQSEHREKCGPYCMALEVENQAVRLELLIRGLGCISCRCLSFASVDLRNLMIAYLEDILSELKIRF